MKKGIIILSILLFLGFSVVHFYQFNSTINGMDLIEKMDYVKFIDYENCVILTFGKESNITISFKEAEDTKTLNVKIMRGLREFYLVCFDEESNTEIFDASMRISKNGDTIIITCYDNDFTSLKKITLTRCS